MKWYLTISFNIIYVSLGLLWTFVSVKAQQGGVDRYAPLPLPQPALPPPQVPLGPPELGSNSIIDGGYQSRQCTSQMQYQIRNVCAKELDQYGVFSQSQGQVSAPNALTWDHLRRRSRQLFQQICTAFENWDRCVSPYKAYCFFAEPIKGQHTVAHEALAYVCRPPAYSDMLNNWDCLLQAAKRSDLIMCENQIMQDSIGTGNSAPMGMNLREGETACRVLQDYVSCIKRPIWDQCGPVAWSHVREAFQRPTQVYLPYCTLAGTSNLPSIATIVLTVLGALFYCFSSDSL